MCFKVLIGEPGVPQILSALVNRPVREPHSVLASGALLTLAVSPIPTKAGVYGLSPHLPRPLAVEVFAP
jgi:hypothetical protein